MKIVKPKPKCKGCDHWKIMVHCHSVMLNGCDTYWCYLCWPDHSKIHDEEWSKLSDEEKNRIIYGGQS